MLKETKTYTLSDFVNQVSFWGDANVPMKIMDAEAGKTYKITWVACGKNGITIFISPTTYLN